jgi:predicted nucleic acid-binding Zn ribbon protein
MSQTKLGLVVEIKNHCLYLDCSVCYKKIYRDYFICSEPCNKVFHVDCVEKMIKQTVIAAYEVDEKPQYKCCYCRRSFNIADYLLELDIRYLRMLMKTGCYTRYEAWHKFELMIKTDDSILYKESICFEDVMTCHNYEVRDITRIKKPKQANLKKKHTFAQKQPRIHVKQNIGGRRRS